MRRRLIGPLGVATALVAGFGLFAGTAFASPSVPSDEDIASVDAAADEAAAAIAALEAELAANQAALDAATIAAAVAAEDYNEAVVALEAAEAEQESAQEAQADAEAELDAASAALAELAMASYRSGGDLAQIASLLSADGLEDAIAEATTYQVLGTSTADAEQRYADAEVAATAANERAAAAVTERTAAAAELEEASEAAEQAADEAAAIVAANATRRDELVAELAALRQTSVEMEAARQEAAEAERLAEENAQAAAALGVEGTPDPGPSSDGEPTTGGNEPTGNSEPSGNDGEPSPSAEPTSSPAAEPAPEPTTAPATRPEPEPEPEPTTTSAPRPSPTTTKPPATTPPPAPPSSSANAAALAWAKTQLGKPYIWGAEGPNGYDCSGLTMMAYANAGITIPRTSRAQYYAGDLVPVGQMRPGDLIFYSSNGSPSGIYHVAIYAGNGMRLHAPSAGKNVELVPMWWRNVLPYAARP